MSFSIHDNEIVGLLGPNGAGKTTLINILTCKLNPNFGRIKVFGYDYSHSREVRQLISVVPQFDVFFEVVCSWRILRETRNRQFFDPPRS